MELGLYLRHTNYFLMSLYNHFYQKVGFSTKALGALNEGDYIRDFVGPLGKPTDVEGKKRVCVVGGGVGCAIALPAAVAFKEAGAEVDVIIGFRTKDIVILEDEFRACSDHLYLMTDDGSYGEKGFGTVKLQVYRHLLIFLIIRLELSTQVLGNGSFDNSL